MNAHQAVDSSERAAGRSAPHRSSGDGAGAVHTAAPVAGPIAGDRPSRRRWNSLQLLGDQYEIEIAHADSIYRLRVTSLGKLILTK